MILQDRSRRWWLPDCSTQLHPASSEVVLHGGAQEPGDRDASLGVVVLFCCFFWVGWLAGLLAGSLFLNFSRAGSCTVYCACRCRPSFRQTYATSNNMPHVHSYINRHRCLYVFFICFHFAVLVFIFAKIMCFIK